MSFVTSDQFSNRKSFRKQVFIDLFIPSYVPFFFPSHCLSYWAARNLEPIPGDSGHKTGYIHTLQTIVCRDANHSTMCVFGLWEEPGVTKGNP